MIFMVIIKNSRKKNTEKFRFLFFKHHFFIYLFLFFWREGYANKVDIDYQTFESINCETKNTRRQLSILAINT